LCWLSVISLLKIAFPPSKKWDFGVVKYLKNSEKLLKYMHLNILSIFIPE